MMIVKISSRWLMLARPKTNSANKIEASPLGPNHPRKMTVSRWKPPRIKLRATGIILITVRLKTPYMTILQLKWSTTGQTQGNPEDHEGEEGEQLPLRLRKIIETLANRPRGVAQGEARAEGGDEPVSAYRLGHEEGQ